MSRVDYRSLAARIVYSNQAPLRDAGDGCNVRMWLLFVVLYIMFGAGKARDALSRSPRIYLYLIHG